MWDHCDASRCWLAMVSADQRIRDLALVIHDQHGDEAVAEAFERARNWREAEDHPMAAVWTQVAEECRKLDGGGRNRQGGKMRFVIAFITCLPHSPSTIV